MLTATSSQSSGSDFPWLALASLTVSAVALGYTFWRARQERQLARTTLFMTLHRALIEPDIQIGRRRLRDAESTEKFARQARSTNPAEREAYAQVGRALAMLDVLGLHVEKNLVDKDLVLGEWRGNLAELRPAIEMYLPTRAPDAWPHLRMLLAEAAR